MGVPLLTSEAVLTEVFHLAARERIGFEDAWEFVDREVLVVASIGKDELPEIHRLMTRYADRPMDFADATLVYLAKRESISTILTIDFSDFATYRIEGNRPFSVLPSRKNYRRRSASNPSSVLGQSFPSSLDKLRSASTAPPVWHWAQ
jgi:predicted nucleic acid-binding protein